jgi:hypothetical protein
VVGGKPGGCGWWVWLVVVGVVVPDGCARWLCR